MDDNPLVSPRGYQAGQDGAGDRLRPRGFQRPVRRIRRYSPAVFETIGSRSRRNSSLRDERREELLDASNGLLGDAEAVRHPSAAGFDLKDEKGHEAVSRQLTKKSGGGLCR